MEIGRVGAYWTLVGPSSRYIDPSQTSENDRRRRSHYTRGPIGLMRVGRMDDETEAFKLRLRSNNLAWPCRHGLTGTLDGDRISSR